MSQVTLNPIIRQEINNLIEKYHIEVLILEEFAQFIIENHLTKPLNLHELKKVIYKKFNVINTPELKKSRTFIMATDGLDHLNLSLKANWEQLYREFIGILPGEEDQQGYGCINGINIFNYFKPWQVFNLDPKRATSEEIKQAYHKLSKIYHPDIPITGNSRIFDRLNQMYKSITAVA